MKRQSKIRRKAPKINITKQKEELSEDQIKRKQWMQLNSETFDSDSIFNTWQSCSKQIKKPILDLAIQTYAFSDAVNSANSDLTIGLNMKEGGIDTDTVVKLLEALFRVELASVYLQNNRTLTLDQRNSIIDRIIAQQFPTRDNIAVPARMALPLNQPDSDLAERNAFMQRKGERDRQRQASRENSPFIPRSRTRNV